MLVCYLVVTLGCKTWLQLCAFKGALRGLRAAVKHVGRILGPYFFIPLNLTQPRLSRFRIKGSAIVCNPYSTQKKTTHKKCKS